MAKAILFDLWDTVIYICGPHPVIQLREKLGLQKMDMFQFSSILEKSIMTKPFQTVEEEMARLLKDLGIDFSDSLLNEASSIWKKGIHSLYFPPVMEEAIKGLRPGFKLGIITNTDRFPFEFARHRYGFEKYFDDVTASFDVGVVKPDKRIFEAALGKIGAKPEDCVMCGDSMFNDIMPAKEMGMKTILVDTKCVFAGMAGADTTVSTLHDFIGSLKKVEG